MGMCELDGREPEAEGGVVGGGGGPMAYMFASFDKEVAWIDWNQQQQQPATDFGGCAKMKKSVAARKGKDEQIRTEPNRTQTKQIEWYQQISFL